MIPPEKQELVHNLWDALALLPASQPDEALAHLLATMARLLRSETGYWVGACRLREGNPEDAMQGWRMGPVFRHKALADGGDQLWRPIKEIPPGHPAEWFLANLASNGRFRSSLLSQFPPGPDFDAGMYRQNLWGHGYRDALCVATPITERSEVCVSFFRGRQQPDFDEQDLKLACYGLRSLAWFHRRVLLSHGLLLAGKPLTHMERRVLRKLLTDCSEKQIAEELNQKMDTTHKHVGSIYRKFGVNSRAGLMSVWLGHEPAQLLG